MNIRNVARESFGECNMSFVWLISVAVTLVRCFACPVLVYAMETEAFVIETAESNGRSQEKQDIRLGSKFLYETGLIKRSYCDEMEMIAIQNSTTKQVTQAIENLRLGLMFLRGNGRSQKERNQTKDAEKAGAFLREAQKQDWALNVKYLAGLFLSHGEEILRSVSGLPLYWAAEKDETWCFEKLLSIGGDTEHGWMTNKTPIEYAADNGNKELVEQLLNYGANINVWSIGSIGRGTPLWIAAKNGNKELVEFLISRSGSVSAPGNLGHKPSGGFWILNPLQVAVMLRHFEVVKVLLDRGGDASGGSVNDVDPDGWSPLYLAVFKGYKDMVELLLAHKADVKVITNDGDTCLHEAIRRRDNEIIEILLAHGADPLAEDKEGVKAWDYTKQENIKGLLLGRTLCYICLMPLIAQQRNIVPIGPNCAHQIHAICREEGLTADVSYDTKCPICKKIIEMKECFYCFEEFDVDGDNGILIGQNCTHRIHANCRKEGLASFKGKCPLDTLPLEKNDQGNNNSDN